MTPQPRTQIPDSPRPHAHTRTFEVEDILAKVLRKARQRKEERLHGQEEDADEPAETVHDCHIAPRELPPGTQVGGYTLIRVLGAGGFAVTYLATEDATGQQTVLKEHFPEYLCYRESGSNHVLLAEDTMQAACEATRSGFRREHHLLASLQHPHIPRATAFFEANNTAYYAMEYIDGPSLAALQADYSRHGALIPQEEAYATLVRLLDTLAYLHSKKLLHRDIKPENILITREGLPKLIDFGAAHDLSSKDTPFVVETPGFSPVEQGHMRGKLGPWTDIYALGATFHYLLTGDILTNGRQRELIDNTTPLTQQEKLRSHYHPRLLASIDRATQPHAAERYPHAEAWFAALRGGSEQG